MESSNRKNAVSVKANWLDLQKALKMQSEYIDQHYRVERLEKNIVYRVINVFWAICIGIVSTPLLILGVALVWIGSGRPILYRQKRVGFQGKIFWLVKLRTMELVDGESQITRFGAFLRKHRIDEIPQIWNIIRGDMNLVGPRPEMEEIVPELLESIPGYQQRWKVRPGITGWAQVNSGYADTVKSRMEKNRDDLYYIIHRSFVLDLKIILRTVSVVLTGKGAR
ncbi:MAG: sugar transferase [Bdellovibrionota bacterium]